MSEEKTDSERATISVPAVGGPEAADATDRIEALIEKYNMAPKDVDTLFNSMIAVYIRGRISYGDRQPSMCSMSSFAQLPNDPRGPAGDDDAKG